MLILSIRTDKPQAEVGLFNDTRQITQQTWQAHRLLAETIHLKIREMLGSQKKELNDVQAVIVFKGPGSFTGLRIGISVANTLADSLGVPIGGSDGDDWAEKAIAQLQAGNNDRIVLPEYGAAPHVTKPKH